VTRVTALSSAESAAPRMRKEETAMVSEKVAIVTGGGSGIGEASAKKLAVDGAAVSWPISIRRAASASSQRSGVGRGRVVLPCRYHGAGGSRCSGGARGWEAWWAAPRVEQRRRRGRVGPAARGFGRELGDPLKRNLSGTFYCMRAEIAHFLEHGGGAIVNTASGAGLRAGPNIAAVVATKTRWSASPAARRWIMRTRQTSA